ncbi:MAG: 30S ribosomal protein S4e [Desulfonauticus sp.]|nr:30S ribosomal protein S4e [Desulfonauticus sp.]
MGKKGASTSLKRKPAPRSWPIHRKEFVWTVKPSPGPHSLENCLPLAIILREILGFAQTRKESKAIVSSGKVYVDGKIRREDDFPVGLMDVISILEVDKCFRILPSKKGLILHSIDREEAKFKLCRIENKTTVKKGHVQLNLHDGSNILIKASDSEISQGNTYKTFDVLKISLPEREILEYLPLKEGAFAIITGGKNVGNYGRITEIEKVRGKKRRNALVKIEDEKGNNFQTILNFVFVIGENKPLISLQEVL